MQLDDGVSRVTFGLFEADLHSGELWKSGFRVRLSRQPFRVLAELLARPGDIVTREDLKREVWDPNTNVDFDQAIAAAINKIREALGDSAENPRFIQTLTRRGYRFIAPVSPVFANSAPLPVEAPQQVGVDAVVIEVLNKTTEVGPESDYNLQATSSPATTTAYMDNAGSLYPGKLLASAGQGYSQGSSNAFLRQPSPWHGKAIWLNVCVLALALIAGAFVGSRLLTPAPKSMPYRVDQISHYVPISLGPPNPESFLTMAIDGNRVLTSVMVNGRPRLSAIDVDTGEAQEIALPDEISSNSLTDVSRDGSKLLLRSQQSTASEQPLWVVPSNGGSGRRLPGVLAHDAAWMPDGTGIVYATGNTLAEVTPNEDSSTVYAKLPGRAFWLRWSPDGKLLRFTLSDPVTHVAALWEMTTGSHIPRPVSIPDAGHLSACCGVWLPDGQSYIFQANDNLWELKGFGRNAALLQLTNGPLRSLSPVAARSGDRIFFLGLEAPSGLEEFDPQRKEFRSAPAFLADANRVDYSKDGKWVAWADIHEKLWRAHLDGSDKVRLTPDDLEVFLAHWSPDGKRLAVMARKPGGVWQIYLVDASGSKAEVLLNEARNAADPGWSADGGSLVFGREPDLMGKESGSHDLQIINLAAHKEEELPNSEGLFSPRWSPDGRWIVALTLDQKSMMLYDVAGHHWQHLASTSVADPVWSADSKAIYMHAFLAEREPILRVEVPSGTIQTVADLGNFHDGEAANYFFGGITRQGEPLVQPRVGTGNLYTLNLAVR